MSWAVGEDLKRRRHIGYGVPATCDFPDCGVRIDRGLSYACGGGVVSDVENCGLFFCPDHLNHLIGDDDSDEFRYSCERCANNAEPFDPSPDVAEWASHVLSDPSWQEWRDQYPDWATAMRTILDGEADHG